MKRLPPRAMLAALLLGVYAMNASAGPTLRFAPGLEACVSNCGQISLEGYTLFVKLLDKAGKPFKVLRAEVDTTASSAVVSASPVRTDGPDIFGVGNPDGHIVVKSVNAMIDTPSHRVANTVLYYYADGQLVDAQMNELRFSKSAAP